MTWIGLYILQGFYTSPKVACVAGGISRASAFVSVAKPWTRVAEPWEDWWRVEFHSRPHRSRNPSMAAPPRLARSRIPPAMQATPKGISRLAHRFIFFSAVTLVVMIVLQPKPWPLLKSSRNPNDPNTWCMRPSTINRLSQLPVSSNYDLTS